MSGRSNKSSSPVINPDCSLNTERLQVRNMQSPAESYLHWLREMILASANPIRSSVPGFQQPAPFPLPTNQSVTVPSDLENIPVSLWTKDDEHDSNNRDLPTWNELIQFVKLNKDSLDDLVERNKKSPREDDKVSNDSSSGFAENPSPSSEKSRSPIHAVNYCDGNDLNDLVDRRQHQQWKPCSKANAIPHEKLQEFVDLAMRGGEMAEILAKKHNKRPFFTKIDNLCGQMKADLSRRDQLLTNIDSQGLPWAIKDFIFVFTRVISCWIIMKGYVYNSAKGLDKVKSAYSPTFIQSFLKWQDSTLRLVDNLIQSFMNLDKLVQSQKRDFHKSANNFKANCPLRRKSCGLGSTSKNNINSVNDKNGLQINDNSSSSYICQPIAEDLLGGALETMEQQDQLRTQRYLDINQSLLTLLPRILELEESQYFFTSFSLQNYFPDFATKYPFIIDLNTILLKTKMIRYKHLSETIHDLKSVIFYAKIYLQTNNNDELQICISKYEEGINNILKDEPFKTRNYDHIVGNPNEVYFANDIF